MYFTYFDSQRHSPWVNNSRTQIQKKTPQKQQFVLYYPPPKPAHNPYAKRLVNIKIKHSAIKNKNNNYTKNKNYNKIIPEEPEVLQYQQKLPLDNLETGKERAKVQNGQIGKGGKNGFNNQIRNRELKKNIYGNADSYPPVPNSFMEPPGFASSDYRLYQKAEGNPVGWNEKQHYKNHKMEGEDDMVKNFDDRAPYVRDHAPENESEELEDSSELDGSQEENQPPPKKSNPSEISPDGDRVQFQIHGHAGPMTYVFGFDTGDGENRQYRLEERLKNGTVKGQYGYYDARGKLRAIQYTAGPLEGYEEKHHESILPSSISSS
ncbi:uncharacterized protein LOC117169102 isoform X2 [Belonocnema kinseyi]|uniref:uncharacterized protein LOC117169102 isoform X2 n=1 Tax=Belonocnema kinseyi TaxID=2817044 RepID=UPI00143D4773|nr:uncharacterized protein LOC117169102 isoform X2 [Belonocnema kinseyi]